MSEHTRRSTAAAKPGKPDTPTPVPLSGKQPVPLQGHVSVEQLVAHQKELGRRALRLTGDGDRAMDLVQDTFERAMRSRHAYQPGTNQRAWLLRIMLNAFLDSCCRELGSRGRLTPDALVPIEAASPSSLPEETWHTLEPLVSSAMSELRAPLRQVMELKLVQRLTYREISDRVGIPVRTVATRLQEGRLLLHKLLSRLTEETTTQSVPAPIVPRTIATTEDSKSPTRQTANETESDEDIEALWAAATDTWDFCRSQLEQLAPALSHLKNALEKD